MPATKKLPDKKPPNKKSMVSGSSLITIIALVFGISGAVLGGVSYVQMGNMTLASEETARRAVADTMAALSKKLNQFQATITHIETQQIKLAAQSGEALKTAIDAKKLAQDLEQKQGLEKTQHPDFIAPDLITIKDRLRQLETLLIIQNDTSSTAPAFQNNNDDNATWWSRLMSGFTFTPIEASP